MHVSNELKSTESGDSLSRLIVESVDKVFVRELGECVRLTILKKFTDESPESDHIETIEVNANHLMKAIQNAMNNAMNC